MTPGLTAREERKSATTTTGYMASIQELKTDKVPSIIPSAEIQLTNTLRAEIHWGFALIHTLAEYKSY